MPRLATAATPATAKLAPAAAKKMPATAGNAIANAAAANPPHESKHSRPRDAAHASRGTLNLLSSNTNDLIECFARQAEHVFGNLLPGMRPRFPNSPIE